MRSSYRVLYALLLLTGGCDSTVGRPCTTSSDCTGDDVCRDAVCVDREDSDGGADGAIRDAGSPYLMLEIDPEDAVLTALNGSMPTQTYQAVGVTADGTRTPVAARFNLTQERIGTITEAGEFSSNGVTGGATVVQARFAGLTVMTTLTIQIEHTHVDPGVPVGIEGRYSPLITDGTRRAGIVYPLEAAWMPVNVAAPDIQWDRGVDGDVYRITISVEFVSITAFVLHTGVGFELDWLVPDAIWSSVIASAVDETVTITVDRWILVGGAAIEGEPRTIRIARGGVYGEVYYWDLNDGRIQRIGADTAAIDRFMPDPPPNPRTARQCIACHTVSRDGRYLAAILWSDDADAIGMFDLTTDLTTSPAATVHVPEETNRYSFASFNPDASRLIAARHDGAFSLIDVVGGRITAATGLPTSAVTHPEWAPDGSSIAMIGNTNATTPGHTFSAGDLMLLPQTGIDEFGTPTVLHAGADLATAVEGGSADSHPTWSPGSRHIAFTHGTASDSGLGGSTAPGALYLIDATGGAPVRLDNAAGGATVSDTYWPTFSPFETTQPDDAAGSLYWLAFFSTRDYGNDLTGTRGSGRRQLWVTAISTDLSSGDGSRVGYWLPGQATDTDNVAAFWGPSPCRTTGVGCSAGSECCTGECAPDPGSGSMLCAPPPVCRAVGEGCTDATDCCEGGLCDINVCVPELF